MCFIGKAIQKNYLDREIIPTAVDLPTIGTVSEHLDRDYWYILSPQTFPPPKKIKEHNDLGVLALPHLTSPSL